MGSVSNQMSQRDIAFISAQPVFFVATAASSGRVNISPKGGDSIRVLAANRVAWLNLTGSGNETAAHVLQSKRMTLMFCSFASQPMILRLYGHASMYNIAHGAPEHLSDLFDEIPGARQIFDLQIDLVQQSCGWGVPEMHPSDKGSRGLLESYFHRLGPEGLTEYHRRRNSRSIDGFPTGL